MCWPDRSGAIKASLLKPLLPGGRIGICSPAAPVKEEKLRAAIAMIRNAGYDVVTAPSTFGNAGLFAAPDSDRCRELEDMFNRKDIDAVFCSRGGVGSNRLAEILNTDLIAKSRKPFLGFSDITALQWQLLAQQGFISFSGPLATEWDGSVDERSLRAAFQMLSGKQEMNLLSHFLDSNVTTLKGKGKIKGRLLPGNLTMITTMLGTSFLPQMNGAVLFIEDVGEPPYRVDRMLFHLRNSGVLANLAGILVGDFQTADDIAAQKYLETSLLEATRGMNYPIVINLPYGHGKVRMTCPVGAEISFDPEDKTMSLSSPIMENSL
jgi:muramoyltetrapeptide carboxypeptidase